MCKMSAKMLLTLSFLVYCVVSICVGVWGAVCVLGLSTDIKNDKKKVRGKIKKKSFSRSNAIMNGNKKP